MEYHLYPPFFNIDGEDFDDAWEILCCRLLNLKHRTHEISRIKAPDESRDLYWEAKRIAYQCKAVRLGSKLNLTEVKKSIERAKEKQAEIGWQKYILCTNVDLTSPIQRKIKQMLPTIEFITGTQWGNLCIEFDYAVTRYFLRYTKFSPNKILCSIKSTQLQQYLQQVQENTKVSPFNIIVCCNRYQEIFELPVLPDYSVSDLTEILRQLFGLPKRRDYRDVRYSSYIEYSIELDNEKVPLHKKLSELPLMEKPIVTLRIRQYMEDQDGRIDENSVYLATLDMLKYITLSKDQRRQIAKTRHQEEATQLFKQAVERIRDE